MPIQGDPVEFIQDRLYYATISSSVSDTSTTHYFTTDSTLVYYPFEQDFGPLNLGQTYVFFAQLSNKLKDPKLKSKKIIYYSGVSYNLRANAITLISLFMVCVLQKQAHDISEIVKKLVQPPLVPFRDACMGPCSYNHTVADCLFGIERAMKAGLFSLTSFKYDDYYFYSQVENGDLTWMIPDKIIAFAGPVSQSHPFFRYHPFTPASYIPLYKSRNVTAVVRLNEACYNRADFIKAGIHHYDIPFPDGSCPSDKIIKQFIEIVDKEKGTVAVHCKAGLGRTGSLIALYMMQRYDFTAREIIAWLRVLRPGSVLGQQQQFLLSMEKKIKNYYNTNAAPGGVSTTATAVQPATPRRRSSEVVEGHVRPRTPTAGRDALASRSSGAAAALTPGRPLGSRASGGASSALAKPTTPRITTTDRVKRKLEEYLNSPTRTPAGSSHSSGSLAINRSAVRQRLVSGIGLGTSGTALIGVGRSGARSTTPTGGSLTKTVTQTPGRRISGVNVGGSLYGTGNATPLQRQTRLSTGTPGRSSVTRSSTIGNDELLAYGFGANGRVHPDVVHTPKNKLQAAVSGSRGLSGARTSMARDSGGLPSIRASRSSSLHAVTDMYK